MVLLGMRFFETECLRRFKWFQPTEFKQSSENKSMASNKAVLVENAVSKLYFIILGISTFLNEHFQLVQFHLKLSKYHAIMFSEIIRDDKQNI